ncbi:MAG: sugar transferase [Bacteroidota bacterium]
MFTDIPEEFVSTHVPGNGGTMKSSTDTLLIGAFPTYIIDGFKERNYECLHVDYYKNALHWLSANKKTWKGLEALFCVADYSNSEFIQLIEFIQKNKVLNQKPLIFYSPVCDNYEKKLSAKIGADDHYCADLKFDDVIYRINFLKDFKKNNTFSLLDLEDDYKEATSKGIPLYKRLFDIFISGGALLILSPLLILVAILIRIDSPGPIFYVSKRAGKGYHIFNFYKFRSMRVGADAELHKLNHLNQYTKSDENDSSASAFVKIENDPRVTRLGSLLRKSSIDELPQLINVLKGDMSIVGNRPLPLYEAEQLTKDEIVKRFNAPAGITGLWQVTKRGKSDMSEYERIRLDITYADRGSFWYDIKIMLMTIPALFQKEKV